MGSVRTASCPFVTTVGGTIRTNPEVAVSFSGGGFSNFFARPRYAPYVNVRIRAGLISGPTAATRTLRLQHSWTDSETRMLGCSSTSRARPDRLYVY